MVTPPSLTPLLGCRVFQERNLRESNDTRRSANITELVMLKDREKQLQFDLEQTREQLGREQGRVQHYMEQVIVLCTLYRIVIVYINTTSSCTI